MKSTFSAFPAFACVDDFGVLTVSLSVGRLKIRLMIRWLLGWRQNMGMGIYRLLLRLTVP